MNDDVFAFNRSIPGGNAAGFKSMRKEIFEHGYVELIESWGSDKRIIESARTSTNKGFLGWEDECIYCRDYRNSAGSCCPDRDDFAHKFKNGDQKLLEYLYRNNHLTPFEMCGATFEIAAPIFVFRELQSYNEISTCDVQVPEKAGNPKSTYDFHYVPSIERIMNSGQDTKNKQGSKKLEITQSDAECIQIAITDNQRGIYEQYEYFLKLGVSKEIARINTPVSRFSKMRASANLRNWLHFLLLRNEEHAQFEIREYARIVQDLLTEKFPRTINLFELDRTT